MFFSGHVTKEMESRCNKWLLGDTGDNRECTTTKETIDLPDKSPYYKYIKYRVRFPREPEPVDME